LSVRPKGFFLENVSGLITGHGIDTILGDLSEMGFDAQWGSVKAADVGASHRRERVFILAARRGTDCRFDDILGNTKNIRCEQPKKTDRRRECEPLNRNEIRNIPSSTSNAELDDTEHERHEERMQSKTISSRCRQNDGQVEDTNDTRFHRTQSDGTEREREKTNQEQTGFSLSRTRGSSEDNELANTTTFPPAPNSEEWESILREHPRLSPALEKSSFEPDVRGMVNGVAPGLHRADRLRILGNGVVPIQAAYALTVLARRFQT
jgi:DNA (cytosine-5)-methyltransferase 1